LPTHTRFGTKVPPSYFVVIKLPKHVGVGKDHELYFTVFYLAHLLVNISNVKKYTVWIE